MLHKVGHGLAIVYYGVDQDYGRLPLQLLKLNILGLVGVQEDRLWEGIADAECHGFTAAHDCDDGYATLVDEAIAVGGPALDVADLDLLDAE